MRYGLLKYVLVLLLVLPQTTYASITKGPYLQNAGSGSMTVMWETSASSASEVDYGPTSSLGLVATGASGTVHEVTVSPLKEDAAYYYRVVSGGEGSQVYTFRTFSKSATAFRFVAFGDSRSDPEVVHRMSGLVEALDPRPALALHTGDVVSDGSKYRLWGSEWFTPQHPMMAEIPVFTVLGNHENDSPNYFRLFSLPGNERWYYVEYGDAVFIALDTNSPVAPGSEQYKFLDDTLRRFAGKTWKFVFCHHPPFSTGGHGSDLAVRKSCKPLFDRYGVSIVFSGHDHDYERSEVDGVTYVVTGGFGAPLYDRSTCSPSSKFFAMSHHYCVVDVSDAGLVMSVKDASGNTLEDVRLSPPRTHRAR